MSQSETLLLDRVTIWLDKRSKHSATCVFFSVVAYRGGAEPFRLDGGGQYDKPMVRLASLSVRASAEPAIPVKN